MVQGDGFHVGVFCLGLSEGEGGGEGLIVMTDRGGKGGQGEGGGVRRRMGMRVSASTRDPALPWQ